MNRLSIPVLIFYFFSAILTSNAQSEKAIQVKAFRDQHESELACLFQVFINEHRSGAVLPGQWEQIWTDYQMFELIGVNAGINPCENNKITSKEEFYLLQVHGKKVGPIYPSNIYDLGVIDLWPNRLLENCKPINNLEEAVDRFSQIIQNMKAIYDSFK